MTRCLRLDAMHEWRGQRERPEQRDLYTQKVVPSGGWGNFLLLNVAISL